MSALESEYSAKEWFGPPVRRLVAQVPVGASLSHENNLSINEGQVSYVLPSPIRSWSLSYLDGENASDSGVTLTEEESCRSFSLDEILIATDNFDDALVVGNGGFGKVYKGFIENGAKTVAVKRLNAESKQGAKEFWTEVKMLSRLRHPHLVALIGYCEDCQEMILVYEYIARGTLSDHLYKTSGKRRVAVTSRISWDQRLYICIGAARGLDYLHTGTDQSFIHRDVKTTNILLDENWVAKISDFGLSKGATSHSITHVSTDVRGTFGYLDPDYFLTQRLTKKSDVYAFGVVLLEVLCGRQPVDTRLEEEEISLVNWVRHCSKKGKLDDIIDPSLNGQISPRCLKYFLELAGSCLHTGPKSRPTMAQVVAGLELALVSQQKGRTEGLLTKVFLGMDRWLRERKDNDSASGPSKDLPDQESHSGTVAPSCRRFTLAEIRVATNDFSEHLLLHNSDRVYKGRVSIRGRAFAVAIKRSNKVRVVEAEVQVQSLLHHPNVVALIGFCHEEDELILVYDYVANGSLRDQLNHSSNDPLTWEKRLQICIGVAQGLQYLHAEAEHGVIHCNIKPSNILLDKNWVAKVLYLKLSNSVTTSSNSSIPGVTNSSSITAVISSVARCHNCLGPEYDLYSFGLVLLEVLTCNKQLNQFRNTMCHDVPLLSTLKSTLQSENIYEVIDPNLTGKIAPKCLREFVKISLSCVFQQGVRRPMIEDVVRSLQSASQLQKLWRGGVTIGTESHTSSNQDVVFNVGESLHNRVPGYGCTEGPLGTVFIKL